MQRNSSSEYETGAITGCLFPQIQVPDHPAQKVGSELQRALESVRKQRPGLFHLKAAGRCWPPHATFFHACANDAGEQ